IGARRCWERCRGLRTRDAILAVVRWTGALPEQAEEGIALPRVPVPPEVDDFLAQPNPAVVATLRPDGSPHTVPTWYDWEDGRVLLNMDESRLRLQFMQRDPRAALTGLDEG